MAEGMNGGLFLPRVQPLSPRRPPQKDKGVSREGEEDSRKCYNKGMADGQLPLFQRKTYRGIIPTIPLEIQAPTPYRTILQTLPAYYTYLQGGGFSKYTPDDFTGDLKKFGLFQNAKPIKEIQTQDIQAWITFLKTPSPKGEGLSAKTVSRKLTALGNYFQWLVVSDVITQKATPMLGIANYRISSPLPEILFEQECELLLTTA